MQLLLIIVALSAIFFALVYDWWKYGRVRN
jgi:hypothetical protein